MQGVRYRDSFLRTLCSESSARTLSGRQAFSSSDLITQIHGILPAYDDLRAGPRSLGVDQAADPSPYVPLRELRRVGPPVWDIFVWGSTGPRRLLCLHGALPVGPASTQQQCSADQYRAEPIYHVINSDLG